MTTWLCFPCRGGSSNESHEEVRIEPTSIADRESRSRDNESNPPNQDSSKSLGGETVATSSNSLQVPLMQGPSNSELSTNLKADLSVRSAMPPGAHTPGAEGGTGIVGFGSDGVEDNPITVMTIPPTAVSPVANGAAADSAATSKHPTQEDIIKREEALIEKLKDAKDDVRIWLRDSLVRWRKLPVGDDCEGEAFLEAASTIPAVYPWVFKLTYATTFLSKDYADHISTVRKTWPKGARTMREAVRMEVKAEGSDEKISKKYWKTCSVRLIWICRTMRMFDVIMEVLATSDETPVSCGKTAVDRILTPYLSWALKKIAEYIIGVCCWKTQDLFYEQVKVPPAEFKECVAMLYPLIRKHSDHLEHMLEAEIPVAFKRKCA